VKLDRDYREVATLRDGTPVVLRLVRPEDKDLLARGFARLSPTSRYLRFFSPKASLTDDELRYLTEVDQIHHVALGASTLDGQDGLGVARLIEQPGEPGVAEAAIAVIDDMHGKGLGSLLYERLVEAARERGITRFRCEVLGSNTAMQDFLHATPGAHTTRVDSGVVTIELPLPPEPSKPRESGIYELLRQVARGIITTRAPK
jgi:GNAT superfamily N-acetyltransferase